MSAVLMAIINILEQSNFIIIHKVCVCEREISKKLASKKTCLDL